MHLVGYLCCRLVGVAQFYLDASDECTVYPFFGCCAAGLADDGAQVAPGQTHALGIMVNLVMLRTMLGDQLEEAVEEGLLARTATGLLVSLLTKQTVVVVHLGCHKGCDGGTVIVVGSMHRLPDSVENL